MTYTNTTKMFTTDTKKKKTRQQARNKLHMTFIRSVFNTQHSECGRAWRYYYNKVLCCTWPMNERTTFNTKMLFGWGERCISSVNGHSYKKETTKCSLSASLFKQHAHISNPETCRPLGTKKVFLEIKYEKHKICSQPRLYQRCLWHRLSLLRSQHMFYSGLIF